MKRLFFAGLGGVAILFACSSSTVGGGTAPTEDASVDAAPEAGTGTMCSAARDTLLGPLHLTSASAVTVLSDTGTVKTLYVDASAGGEGTASLKNPFVYVDLGAGTRVDVTDVTAETSTDWDLAFKRVNIFTNGGDTGIGAGGGVEIDQAFEAITDAQVAAATPTPETLFDADCNPKLTANGDPATTFSNWYDYDLTTNIPSPDPNRTFVVRGGTGRLYKVGINAYDALPDGGSRDNMSTGYYVLQVTEVTK